METWDYKMPGNYDQDNQTAWNQTLISKINELSANIYTESLKRLVVPAQLKPLFESLLMYESEKIGNIYRVIFTDNGINAILVEGEQLYILNYPKQYEKTTSII